MERHIVALSGGKDSTAMALRLAQVEPRSYEYVVTPTGNELPEMFDHWRTLGELLGTPMSPLIGGTLRGEIERQNHIPNWRQRWCTRMLKIEPFQAHLLTMINAGDDVVAYVGLRADEEESDRTGAVYGNTAIKQRYPLREWGWGLAEVWGYLEEKMVQIPERTDCAWCFFQTLPEWWTLWKEFPEKFAEAEAIEEKVGHTFRSDGRDTWPASLKGLRMRFEKDIIPKGAGQARMLDTRPMMCRTCSL